MRIVSPGHSPIIETDRFFDSGETPPPGDALQSKNPLEMQEILSRIFAYFPLKSRDALNISLVCRQWRDVNSDIFTQFMRIENTESLGFRDVINWQKVLRKHGIKCSYVGVIRKFENLKVLNLTNSFEKDKFVLEVSQKASVSIEKLTLMGNQLIQPSFNGFNSIRELNLRNCYTLKFLSFHSLPFLEKLDLSVCISLTDGHIEQLWGLKTLKFLSLDSCSGLNMPRFMQLPFLTDLSLIGCQELQNPFFQIGSLKRLDLSNCKSLYKPVFNMLDSLETLLLKECWNLSQLDGLGFCALKTINLEGCLNLTTIDLQNLWSLKYIYFGSNIKLEKIVLKNLPELNGYLQTNSLTSMELEGLSIESICLDPKSLKKVSLKNLHFLEKLELYQAKSLKSNQLELHDLPALEKLLFCYCDRLKKLDLSPFTSLKAISLIGNESLRELNVRGLSKLEQLNLNSSNSLRSVKGISGLSSLTTIDLNAVPLKTKIKVYAHLMPALNYSLKKISKL